MYCHAMKAFGPILVLLVVLGACSDEKVESASSAPTQTGSPSTAEQPNAATSSDSGGSDDEAVSGVWAGQVRIDAHAGVAWLNYVGPESGDFVPMRFRTDSEVGAKILAECADEDRCEVEGSVRFLDEPPPENASAIGEIVSVAGVRKLPPDAR
jgi:hypothetical protein